MAHDARLSETVVIEVLGFVKFLFPEISKLNIVQGQANFVPNPKGRYVRGTFLYEETLAGNDHHYLDNSVDIRQQVKATIQLDFYGSRAQRDIDRFLVAFNDPWGWDWFEREQKISRPLYAEEARQLRFENESRIYENRFGTDVTLQYNKIINFPQQTANFLGDIHVDTLERDSED